MMDAKLRRMLRQQSHASFQLAECPLQTRKNGYQMEKGLEKVEYRGVPKINGS